MPIYDFKCDECGENFEKLQKMNDPIPETCPHCGKSGHIHQCMSAPHFRLAGSGWYETDFKKDTDKKRNLAGESPAQSLGKAPDKTGTS